jgi:NAD(P)H dehydrogenase (quinone)
MKIAVTGATGQLGRIVVNKLKEKTDAKNIIAVVRSKQKASDLYVETREADYEKPDSLASALQGIDTLVFISGSEIGKRAPQHKNVIHAAKMNGVKRIIYTSLLHADRTTLGIAGEHVATENLLKNAGIPFTILRNGWYTENYGGSIANALGVGALYGSADKGKISSAPQKDYAEAIVAVATTDGHQGKTYELAGDEGFTLADLAAEISKQTGKNIIYTNLPVDEYAKALVKAGLPEGVAQMFAGIDVSTSKGDLFDDSRDLSKLIGRPTTPLRDAVKELLKAV